MNGQCTLLIGLVHRGKASKEVRAFTMIEMLVAVGVVATLAAMLIPSLRTARARARTAVCTAHTAGIGRAAATYSTEYNGWLCGSPGTSGSVLYTNPRPPEDAEDIPGGPTQIWDYAGALAPRYMNTSLPPNRALRMRRLVEGIFKCPSNPFEAEPYPTQTGSFRTQPMVSYNTFRNFLLWPRTMVDFDPAKPWGTRAPFNEASFDTIGGHTLRPKYFRPHIDRIVNPAMKVYLADGNRRTDPQPDGTVKLSYDIEWDAEAGGAFASGGPTMPITHGGTFVLSSYHYEKEYGRFAYRHRGSDRRGIVVNYFDGHSAFLTDAQSREPDYWWPKGTVIRFSELNEASQRVVAHRLDASFHYRVGR